MNNVTFIYRPSTLIILTLLVFTACEVRTERRPGERLRIVTTTGMIADAARAVAGAHADVTALMGPGVDPHLYKATHGDLEKLTDADIIFYNGLHLEGKMGEVLKKLSRYKTVVAVSDEIPEHLLRTAPGFQSAHDPHIWFNVKLWTYATHAIYRTLTQADSTHRADYQQGHDAYVRRLDSLHVAVAHTLAQVPEQQRVLITAHDAFGYYGDAYQIEVRGLQGISTLSEFGLRDVTDLVEFIVSRKIKAIFIETSVSTKSINAVIEGCHQRGWPLKIGGSLYSDAMGEAGTPAGNYIGMVTTNTQTIAQALK